MRHNENRMRVASRKDLFTIRCFLENQLPSACDIYQSLVAGMLAPDNDHCIYFKKGLDGTFEAIISTIKENYFDSNRQTVENMWLISFWMKDETFLVPTLEEIGQIDWFKAKWLIYGRHIIHFQSWIIRDSMRIWYDSAATYALPISEALSLQIKVPDDVYVKSLERKHANIVYDSWSYNLTTLVEYVADEIDRFPSAGVFLKNGDVLVTWIMSHPPNGMSRLHTLKPYRRRGYAALAVRYLAKRTAQSGYLPFVNVVSSNESSRRLFESLGFTLIRDLVYVYTPL